VPVLPARLYPGPVKTLPGTFITTLNQAARE